MDKGPGRLNKFVISTGAKRSAKDLRFFQATYQSSSSSSRCFVTGLASIGRHRLVAHRIPPQDHVQLLRIGAIFVGEVHPAGLLRAWRLRAVRRVDQPVIAIGVVRIERRLIAGAGEDESQSAARRRRCCSSAAGPAALPSSAPCSPSCRSADPPAALPVAGAYLLITSAMLRCAST